MLVFTIRLKLHCLYFRWLYFLGLLYNHFIIFFLKLNGGNFKRTAFIYPESFYLLYIHLWDQSSSLKSETLWCNCYYSSESDWLVSSSVVSKNPESGLDQIGQRLLRNMSQHTGTRFSYLSPLLLVLYQENGFGGMVDSVSVHQTVYDKNKKVVFCRNNNLKHFF